MNDSAKSPFTLKVEEPETWKRVVKAEVPREYFDDKYAKRLRAAAKSYDKPGFRKGKVPRAIVEKELGGHLRAEELEALVPVVFRTAVVEHRLSPITDPTLENLVFEDEGPISFDMTIEVRPQIEAKEYDDLPVKRPASNVSGKDVDEVVGRLRESRAIFEKIDRESAAGDELVIDLTPIGEDGQPRTEEKTEGQKLMLGSENNFPAFEEALTGVAAGAEKTVVIEYPADHPNEELRDKKATYLCEVTSVNQKILPEVDDAFAAALQPDTTLLELRAVIRKDLEKEDERRIQREIDEQIVDGLIERNPLEVPPSLIEQYTSSGIEELHGRNAQMGRENSEAEDKEYAEMTRPIAERILKGMFIMESVRRQEKITVTDEQITARIDEMAAENGYDVEKFREYASRGDERDRIMHGLQERTTFDFLLSRAAVVDAEASEGDEKKDAD